MKNNIKNGNNLNLNKKGFKLIELWVSIKVLFFINKSKDYNNNENNFNEFIVFNYKDSQRNFNKMDAYNNIYVFPSLLE